MGINKVEWEYESTRLKRVYKKILEEYTAKKKIVLQYQREILEVGKSMWEEAPHTWQVGELDAAAQIKQYKDELDRAKMSYKIVHDQVVKLEKLKDSPYFARVDFQERGYRDVEQIYIGVSTFIDDRTGDVLIYDWRAPISSIFYDYELGPASYKCPDGVITGDILLKRQFKIHQDHIHGMFDSSLKIDDEILQEILSKSADDKMKTIVTTIQKEQNKIIRNEENDLLMVQGAAGSGKTSIALHRIAYLLYRYRDRKISARDIVIFSPNRLFNDYISRVLPELGEENMQQTTFIEYAEKALGSSFKIEDMNEQMEYILTGFKDPEYRSRIKGIEYKTSRDYYLVLKGYMKYLEKDGFAFKDILFRGETIVSREELLKMFSSDFRHMPLSKRLERIKGRVLYLMRPVWKRRLKEIEEEVKKNPEYTTRLKAISRLQVYKEFKPVRNELDEMLRFDSFEAYYRLFKEDGLLERLSEEVGVKVPDDIDEIRQETLNSLSLYRISYEDLPPFLYLRGEWEGVPALSHIRHLVVDEAQDYTPIQYAIFRQLFPYCSMTILGDFNQAINPYMQTNRYETIKDILRASSPALLKLTKSYRSTKEIVEFTKEILVEKEGIETINRSGEKPILFKADDDAMMIGRVLEDIESLKGDGIESLAVICKTAAQSLKVYGQLREKIKGIRLIQKDDTQFTSGIMVLPSYLAKGLEFDAVLVYDASSGNYGHENERKLLYTACTRALHRLHLFYSGSLSPFLAGIDKELYREA